MLLVALLLLVPVAIVVGLAAAELAVRWRRGTPLWWPLGSARPADDPLGEILQRAPDPLRFQLKSDVDRLPQLATNRLGLRGPAVADEGRRRIWVAGGSDCFGLGLARQSDLWLYHLQSLLDRCSPGRFEVLNLSQGAYGNSQLVQWWRKMPATAGDLLVFRPSFTNIRACRASGAASAWQRAVEGRGAAGDSAWRRWLRRLGDGSYLLADQRRRRAARQKEPCHGACDAHWAAFLERSLLALEELVADAELKGVRPALMSFFPAYRAEMDADERRRLARLESPACRLEDFPVREQFELMDEAVERFVCRMGLPLLDLAPAFWNHPRRFELYLDPVHLNAQGHRVLAETLFATLQATGLLGDDPLAVRYDPATSSAAAGPARPICLPVGAQ